jgi:hypothetical protein
VIQSDSLSNKKVHFFCIRIRTGFLAFNNLNLGDWLHGLTSVSAFSQQFPPHFLNRFLHHVYLQGFRGFSLYCVITKCSFK